jgi:predicted RecB family nuclease
MRLSAGVFEVSATDLSHFLACRHRMGLDMAAAMGRVERPAKHDDPLLELLWKRGLEHEQRYVESLRSLGLSAVDLRDIRDRDEHVAATAKAIASGVDLIVQGALRDGQWFGLPDVLRRVWTSTSAKPTYEVIDTKLARETKAGAILQLGLYSEMLALVQGTRPDRFHVITPYGEHEYRLDDFAAYIRLVRRQMMKAVAEDPDALAASVYPEPVEHCAICHWASRCASRRATDRHLSLVAGISRGHRRELEKRDIHTIDQLAALPVPLPDGFAKRRSVDAYVRLREQARLQTESENSGILKFELRKIVESQDEGLCRLPEPSPGDVFLDLEGDPFVGTVGSENLGREYLFGLVTLEDGKPVYRAFWGMTEAEERRSFEQMMDLIMGLWREHPGMHVYHYAPYETTAFRKLANRHVTRDRELDRLLRGNRFVDLYAVVRQGVLVGSPSYSIKRLEPLYGYDREVDLEVANRCLREIERALELDAPQLVSDSTREAVRGYNEDDCISTLKLRGWLEGVRAHHIAAGWNIPRPVAAAVDEEELTEREQRVKDLRERLLDGIPEDPDERTAEERGRWLLAYLLDYHRREDRASFWEFYALKDLPEDELLDEPHAIGEMTFVERVHETIHAKSGKPTGTVIDRYHFTPQEMEIESGELRLRDDEGNTFGDVVSVDRDAFTIDVKKRIAFRDHHPMSAFGYTHIASRAQEDSLYGIGVRVAEDGHLAISDGARDTVGRSLLLALPPRLASGPFERMPGEETLPFLIRAVQALDHSVLAVQGPPGSGKTYAGAEMICAMVAAGRRVGVAGTSHKIIRNLLEAVRIAAERKKVSIILGHRCDDDEYADSGSPVLAIASNDDAAAALESREVHAVGGTAWLWAHSKLHESVDVLFVDEAGQMSLANVVAMSPCADSIVLLGDPRQLEQPRKGWHPEGVGVSALEHMLDGHKTISDDRGVFLEDTWRLAPTITRFTSELFYEGRLRSRPELTRQRLNGLESLSGSGLWVVILDHEGNQTWSPEEVEHVEDLVVALTNHGVEWTNAKGEFTRLAKADVLVVAPYNAQVSRLARALEDGGVRVGTVDKFQGQEAPVVIYSMATSRPEEAPRGMTFLYSLNRLNVATSRARCAAIIVASRLLFEPECRTVGQMKLANALCRFRELANNASP